MAGLCLNSLVGFRFLAGLALLLCSGASKPAHVTVAGAGLKKTEENSDVKAPRKVSLPARIPGLRLVFNHNCIR